MADKVLKFKTTCHDTNVTDPCGKVTQNVAQVRSNSHGTNVTNPCGNVTKCRTRSQVVKECNNWLPESTDSVTAGHGTNVTSAVPVAGSNQQWSRHQCNNWLPESTDSVTAGHGTNVTTFRVAILV